MDMYKFGKVFFYVASAFIVIAISISVCAKHHLGWIPFFIITIIAYGFVVFCIKCYFYIAPQIIDLYKQAYIGRLKRQGRYVEPIPEDEKDKNPQATSQKNNTDGDVLSTKEEDTANDDTLQQEREPKGKGRHKTTSEEKDLWQLLRGEDKEQVFKKIIDKTTTEKVTPLDLVKLYIALKKEGRLYEDCDIRRFHTSLTNTKELSGVSIGEYDNFRKHFKNLDEMIKEKEGYIKVMDTPYHKQRIDDWCELINSKNE